eukprot:TRINITY_DN3462_c0_g2_i2.p3 TRINITY_DN3462_c0_g2~~TRINITY_DN3462_c0_g2_i2.p3  ORF type:complete len:187 (-),score=61.05 TRINITY_DN3462_c0_g2_i2:24-584(-)
MSMNVVKLLKGDHALVKSLFSQFKSTGDAAKKQTLANDIIKNIVVHSAAEEQIVYPEYRSVMPEGNKIADHSLDEHQVVKNLLAELDKMKVTDAGYDSKMFNMMKNLEEHISEEENSFFPKLEAALDAGRLETLGKEVEMSKMMAPTRPHPNAPATYPANLLNAAAAPFDKVRDFIRDASAPKSSK